MADIQGTQQDSKSGGIAAKPASLWSQIIAAVWIAGWSAYKFITSPQGVDIADVMLSGVGIAACFTPVYLSILMDKIREIRIGGRA